MSNQPITFFGHGSPMNTLESNHFTNAWREYGASLEKPRAVLAISAHWFINATAVTSMAKPRVIPGRALLFGQPTGRHGVRVARC